jgi:hypothetical protein
MGRGKTALIIGAFLLVSAGPAAVVIWQVETHHVPLLYVLGGLAMVSGIGFSILHLSVTDEYLRQHFGGEENASRMRQLWRGGWVGIPLGAALIAAEYFLGANL